MALAYDNSASTTAGGSEASYSASHTLAAAGNNRILVAVFFGMAGSNAATKFTSVACNGASPSGQISPDAEANRYGNYGSISIYYWLEAALPANGSPTAYNVTATAAVGQWNGHLATISFTGAAQELPEADNQGSAQDATSSSISLTTLTADSVIVDAVAINAASPTALGPTAGQTEVQDISAATSYRLGLGYEVVTSATTYSQTWSWTGTSTFNIQDAIAIAPAPPANPVNIETGNLVGGTLGSSFNHTLTDSANRAVLVLIDDESQTQATGVTYNGTAMTVVTSSTSTVGAGNASSIWMILDNDLPATSGSYAVSVSGLDAGAYANAIELNNVAQVIPTGSALDTTETGAVSTTTATATAPSGDSIAVGCAGHGADGTPFNNPPTGTGTWTRLFSNFNPPTSCYFVGAYQAFSTAGSKNYTETAGGLWNRASQCLAIFAAFTSGSVDEANAPFFGCTF